MIDALLTPPLARAARGLLNWQQSDLAAFAGVSLTAIKNFEGGQKRTHKSTALALQNAFEAHGIEFPVSGGLRQIEDISSVYRFAGPEFIRKLNDDIYTSVRKPHEDVFTASASEGYWSPTTSQEYYGWCERMQTNQKMLIPDEPAKLYLPLKVYRIVPREMLGKITYCLYADRLAFIIWKKKQVVVLRNTHVVQTFRSQFLYLWKMGRPVGGS